MDIQSIGSAIPQTARILSQATQDSATASQEAAAAVATGKASVAEASAVAAQQAPTPAELANAVEEVQAAIAPVAQNLQFSIDQDINRTIVKVVDSSTDEVIRQIPSEEIVAIAKAMDKLQGLLIKQEV